MALTSIGDITMPSTPLVRPASTSAVCFGALFWPSDSLDVPPIFFTSSFMALSIWTKNGKLSPGTEVRMVRSFAEAPAQGLVTDKATTAPSKARLVMIMFPLPRH